MIHSLFKILPFLFLASCGTSHADATPNPHRHVISKPLDVTAKSINGGNIITLSDYKGKVVLLNVWVSWCGACLQELPVIQTIEQKFADKDLQIVGVNLDKPQNRVLVKKIIKKTGIEYPVLSDPMATILTAIQVESIPVNVLLDKDGKIAYVSVGYSSENTINLVKKINENL